MKSSNLFKWVVLPTVILAHLTVTELTLAQDVHREFDEKLEIQCHRELRKLNCINRKGEEHNPCVELKKKELSEECKELMEMRKFNK